MFSNYWLPEWTILLAGIDCLAFFQHGTDLCCWDTSGPHHVWCGPVHWLSRNHNADTFGVNWGSGTLWLQTIAWLLNVGLRLPPVDPLLPGINSVLALQFWDVRHHGTLFGRSFFWCQLHCSWQLLRLANLLQHVSPCIRKTRNAELFHFTSVSERGIPPPTPNNQLGCCHQIGSYTESGLSLSKEVLSPFSLWLSWELVVALKGRQVKSETAGNARSALPSRQGRLVWTQEDAQRSKQFNVTTELTRTGGKYFLAVVLSCPRTNADVCLDVHWRRSRGLGRRVGPAGQATGDVQLARRTSTSVRGRVLPIVE